MKFCIHIGILTSCSPSDYQMTFGIGRGFAGFEHGGRIFVVVTIKKSKKISNDQELIQSDPTSCPQNQKGNN